MDLLVSENALSLTNGRPLISACKLRQEIGMMRPFASMLVGITLSLAVGTQVFAEPLALASCEKFTSAKDEKAALFSGYIYGFLAARLGYKDEKRLTATAIKLRTLALDFCRKNQSAYFVKVVDTLTAEAAKKAWLQKLL